MSQALRCRKEWERCKPYIADALSYSFGTHAIEDIEAGIASGQFHFWPGDKCAAITEVFTFPRTKFLNVFLVGGDLSEIKAMQQDFISWAKFNQCSRLVSCGRAGWVRALKDQGWKQEAISLHLEISK
jgi:hypothetical protein